jgi:uncharacterized RDD family membrane protein YckC
MFRPPPTPALSLAQCLDRAGQPAPALIRRLAAMLYEGVLLFGVVMAVGLVYSVAANQRHGLEHRQGMQAALFLALSVYFIWFWTRGGQTLAMKTWQLRLIRADGMPVTLPQAAARYLLSWIWFWPPLLLVWLSGWHQLGQIFGLMLAWILAYAALSRIQPQGQFLHDHLCKTRLIDTRA